MSTRGFTLIELLVVMAIMASLSTLMLLNYRGGSQNFSEQRSLQNIAQAIRSAQVKALGSEDISCIPSPCVYYGVHFDTSSRDILVFASNDNQYDLGEEILGETKEVEQGVEITSLIITVGVSSSGTDTLDVLFSPPDPTVFFNPSASSVRINITGGKSVDVNLRGRVDLIP